MVAVLAHALAVIRRDVLGQPCDPNACAAAALFHDATEIFTGDMPTPVKYQNDDIHEAYRRIEEDAAKRLLETLPEPLRPAYRELLEPLDDVTRQTVKAADTLSAYVKCLEELAECQQAICKILIGGEDFDHLAEEIADATITLEQIRLMFNINDRVCEYMDAKVQRLDDNLRLRRASDGN